MVEMAMGHQHVPDVGEVNAGRLEVLDKLADERAIQRIDQHISVVGLNQPGRHPADPDIVDIVEGLPGLDLLRLGVVEPLAQVRRHLSGTPELHETFKDRA